MPVADGTRSRTSQGEMEGLTAMMQEVLRRLDVVDTRLEALERNAQSRLERGVSSRGEEGESRRLPMRRMDVMEERVTRQTKVDFTSFDGGRVSEWLFKCDCFFELDETPVEMKVSIASVYLYGLAMEWHYAFVKNRTLHGPISWTEYSDAMMTRFGEVEMRRPIA